MAISAMTRIAAFFTLLVTTLVCLLPATPALAQRDRVFVASYGSDSNPCTFGSPCKTFQQAINSVAQGGEVTAIDSAGFGAITISHAVTITSPNGVEAGIAAPASGGAAITINAQPGDTISLNGLTLDGDSVANTDGILFNTGSALEVQNCVIRNFGSQGIAFIPAGSGATSLYVSNTLVSDSGSDGIHMYLASLSSPGAVVGTFDHVAMLNNPGHGLYVESVTTQTTTITVANSVSQGNANGIEANASAGPNAPLSMMVQDSTIANNVAGFGLLSTGSSSGTMWVTRSSVTGNGTGWAATLSAKLLSFGDNNIIGNTAVNTAPPTAGGEK